VEKIDQALESLAKVEIKIDALMQVAIFALTRAKIVFDLDMAEGYICPLCNQPVKFQVDVQSGGVERICACGTGLIPPPDPKKLAEMLAPPKKKEKNDGRGSDESEFGEELDAVREAGETRRGR